MPLIRAEKEALVEKLLNELQESRVALIVAYTRLHMKANDDLRTKAFEQNGKIKMISNNLLRLILKKLDRTMELPEKTLALAYGFNDEVAAAKTLVEFGKESDALEVIGGWVDGNFFDSTQVKTLASLPSKEQLQAQLVGRLSGLIGSLAYSLNYPIQKFAFVVDAVKAAQPAEAAPAPASSEPVEAVAEEPKAEVSEEKPAEAGAPAEEVSTEEPKSETEEIPAETSDEAETAEPVDEAGDSEETIEEVKEKNE